ncbi:MAG: HdeD family acid-resistance protein [Thermoleophilia bacterium]
MSNGTGMMQPHAGYNVIDVKWSWLMTLGVVLLALGIVAIIFPAATSVSMTILIGILLVAAGMGRLVSMFSSTGWGDFLVKLLAAVIYLAAGLMLLVYPLSATVTLTLILGIFFFAQGLANVLVAVFNMGSKSWGWMLFNGIVSIVLGIMIWSNLPSSASWAIGLLVGIWLIFDGWAMIMLGSAKHHMDEVETS